MEKIGCVVPILIGHGDCLLDYDECGIQMPGQQTFEDIKKILGVEPSNNSLQRILLYGFAAL